MKNASRLLYIVSALFAGGFLAECGRLLVRYDASYPMPEHAYLLSYALIYLVPALLFFLLARLAAKKAEGEQGMKKVRFGKLGKKGYR